jgi:organic radical activating enzyme
MNIGLIDVDSHNFPNLALMKISAWHKAQGDTVEWWNGLKYYDRVYQSKVFDATYTADNDFCIQADEVIKGGTGYGLDNALPPEIEHTFPDYSLYGITNTAYGFLTRGCPRACPFCIVAEKEGLNSVKVADVSEWWNGQKTIKLLDPNILACRDHMDLLKQLADTKAKVDITQGADCRMLTEDNINALNKVNIKMLHFAWDLMDQSDKVLKGLELYAKHGAIQDERKRKVYVLTNFSTTMEENLYRIYKLREMQYDPYVMIFDKPHAPREVRKLARWVNNKRIWRTVERFEDYGARRG